MRPPNKIRSLFTILLVAASSFICISPQGLLAGCAQPPAGLVAWWPAEGNALDAVSTNHGVFTNPAYGPGEVGSGFSFDGSGNNVRVLASRSMDVGSGPGMTLEAWIYPTDAAARPIVEWVPKTVGAFGAHFYVNQGGTGTLYANLYDTSDGTHIIQSSPGVVSVNVYQHVAVTYDKGTGIARLFVNGTLVVESLLGSFTPQTSPDLSIGYRPDTVPFGPISFAGRIDEVSLYSRALTTNEVQAIYAAGSAGKCLTRPPVIVTQPASQSVIEENNTSLNVLVNGSQPLLYQWIMDGTNLPGATNATLLLSNVQPANAGTYAVQVTNSVGSIVSSNAQLTVTLLTCAPVPPGLVSWWPAEGNAADLVGSNNGTEATGAGFEAGKVGEAFSFNGVTGNVLVPDSPRLSFTNAFTIELWYRDGGVPAGAFGGLVAKRPYSGACNFGLSISGGPGGGFLVYFLDPNYNSYQGSTFSPLPTPGGWHHLAASYRQVAAEQLEIKTYLDGQLVKTASFSGNLSRTINNAPVYFGCSNPQGGEFFKGDLDEIAIYNRALSDQEIASISSAGALGKCLAATPPVIFSQPTNLIVFSGSTVQLEVGAIGSTPLSYQWSWNGTNLPGATSSALVLTNVQLNQAGSYAAVITNAYGSIVSSNALLTVNPAPPCAAPPAGLVSWWPGEGNANDNEGANNGVFSGQSYGTGEVGQSFSFDGSGNNIRIPASLSMDVGASDGMTIEAWIFSTDNSTGRPIVEWVPKISGTFGVHFYAHAGAPGALYANLFDTANNSHIIQSPAGVVPLNTYMHVAVTYDRVSGIARLFANGAQVAQSTLGIFNPQTRPDLCIGLRPNTVPFGPTSFIGKIDEVSLYSRALSGSEIQTIYSASQSGKCNVPLSPTVFAAPGNQAVTVGQTVSFEAIASGTWPLAYQWSFNSAILPGASNAFLVLTNVQVSQAGNYSVQVTNAYGAALSSNAVLIVNFPPAAVNVANSSGRGGDLVTVPIVLVANGNENGVAFSLNYPPNLLTNLGVNLGSGAAGGSLQFNTNQPGRIGIGVALSSGTTFAPGTQEIAEVTFLTAVSNTAYAVSLNFGDVPTTRGLSDAAAHSLAANFTGGRISVTRSAFEADVSPRPGGDGSVTIVDWVQIGRYVAGLDSPTNASEFQRADCAPRSTLGDGLLTVSDWVQAGRYVAGLDPLTSSGGPSLASGSGVVPLHKEGTFTLRTVSVQGPLLFQGQTGTAVVDLNAQGNENGIGLSLAFDPAVVRYTSTTFGADVPANANPTMDVNANQATNGQVGIIMALGTGISFSPGMRQVLNINFQAVTTNSVNSPVGLTDSPVRRDIADTNANPVVAAYTNGVILVNPRPSLDITPLNQNVSLSWPGWATNYLLQQAAGSVLPSLTWTNPPVFTVLTNNAFKTTVPLSGSAQFYRLKHQ